MYGQRGFVRRFRLLTRVAHTHLSSNRGSGCRSRFVSPTMNVRVLLWFMNRAEVVVREGAKCKQGNPAEASILCGGWLHHMLLEPVAKIRLHLKRSCLFQDLLAWKKALIDDTQIFVFLHPMKASDLNTLVPFPKQIWSGDSLRKDPSYFSSLCLNVIQMSF